MCTIYTLDKKTFTDNQKEIFETIDADSKYNGDGFAALFIGKTKQQVNFIRSMSYESFKTMMETCLYFEPWERCFIHLRAATTKFENINGCHGFQADKYLVFHNGILTDYDAYDFEVDSMLIADKIQADGVEACLDWLRGEAYANVMIVDVETGEYWVSRTYTGTLFTDGQGNYSTNEIPHLIDKEVPTWYQCRFPGCVEAPKEFPKQETKLGTHTRSEYAEEGPTIPKLGESTKEKVKELISSFREQHGIEEVEEVVGKEETEEERLARLEAEYWEGRESRTMAEAYDEHYQQITSTQSDEDDYYDAVWSGKLRAQ